MNNYLKFLKLILVLAIGIFFLLGCTPEDTTPPIITLKGENPSILIKGTAYKEAGATAVDDIDGNINVTITGAVDINKINSYRITYKAKDCSGNESITTRTVNVISTQNTTKPTIILQGKNPLELIKGTAYKEAGATATDTIDGTIKVTISGRVDINVINSYRITYKAKNSAGYETVVTRIVNVISASNISKIYKKSFSYDKTNRVTKEDLGNGNYIKYTYDNSGNLIKQEVGK